jgi:malate permease and related proteins
MLLTLIEMIFGWLALGFFVHVLLLKWRSQATSKLVFTQINRVILFVSLPATMLFALHGLHFETTLLFPVSMAWIIFISALGFFSFWKFSRSTLGALVMTGGLGNTSFVGFPLLTALYGESVLKTAVLTDQPGSFLVLSTLGVFFASYFGAGSASFKSVGLRIIKFPPIWALLIALALRPVSFSETIHGILLFCARSLVPLALISVGSQLVLKPQDIRGREKALILGLSYKLFLAPALMLILALALKVPHEIARITILEAAMAPMITGSIVAQENGLDPELCALMVGIGIPISLLTVPLLAWILGLAGL